MTDKKLMDQRPWGKWEIIKEEPYCKVKKITVSPNHRLSYQKHKFRKEVWVIVKGSAQVTLENEIKNYEIGDVVHIPLGAAHRIKNNGKEELIFIEVQLGSYFGEDDIIRLSDDYNRI